MKRDKKPDELDYSALVGIDSDALEEEWVVHGTRTYDACVLLAHAKKRLSEMKAAEKVAEADAADKIRKNPTKYIPGGKLTEGALKEQIVRLRSVKVAAKRVINAEYRIDMLNAAVKALDTKKIALQDLVKLHGAGYFGNPRVDANTEEKAKEKIKNREKRKTRTGE